jgi:hypothetical protein
MCSWLVEGKRRKWEENILVFFNPGKKRKPNSAEVQRCHGRGKGTKIKGGMKG